MPSLAAILIIVGLAFSPLTDARGQSRSLNAKCTLTIDGAVQMDDRCFFQSEGDVDTFDDLRLQLVCPNGRSVEVSDCIGAEQRVARRGVFGFLYRQGGVARFCWNGGDSRKAHDCYEGLRREGACWENPRAPSPSTPAGARHIRLCAWRR